MPPVIRLEAASFGYGGRTALADVDLDVAPGESIALIGPNGAGKSTLLKGLIGLLAPSSGRVVGAPRTGYLPQSDRIDPEFPISVRQAVAMGRYRERGWLRPMGRADRAAIDDALDRVGLTPLARRRFGDLSGGQRQRALLARAIAGDPELLLLDEPFNGLDQPNREALLTTVRSLTDAGVAVVVSTHDVSLARAVCERALLLHGRVVAAGPVTEVLDGAHLAETFDSDDPHAAPAGD